MDVTVEFTYEAAHQLTEVPPGHPCARLHGHSYHLAVTVAGPVNPNGFVADFADIKAAARPVVKQLDHQLLNDIAGLHNPTVENQLLWLWERIECDGLARLTLRETTTNSASYAGPT